MDEMMEIKQRIQSITGFSDLIIEIQQLPHGVGLPLPCPGTALSAGVDLVAAIDEPIILNPGQRKLIPSGIAIALPEGFEAQIRSRSGLAYKNGVMVLNSPGTIDSDYRGELIGIMMNLGEEPFTFERGMRFAQLVVAQFIPIRWSSVERLDETNRGRGKFGSTGLM